MTFPIKEYIAVAFLPKINVRNYDYLPLGLHNHAKAYNTTGIRKAVKFPTLSGHPIHYKPRYLFLNFGYPLGTGMFNIPRPMTNY